MVLAEFPKFSTHFTPFVSTILYARHIICCHGRQEEKSAYPILFHGVAPRAIKSIAPLLFPSGRSENAFLTSRFRNPFYFGAIWNCDISLRYFL